MSLVLPAHGDLAASVVLLHGYAASAEVNRGDAEAFVGQGVEVVLPDAPGHGQRADGTIERINGIADDTERHAALHDLARRWLPELRPEVERCRARGAERVGLVGVSMGGFTALAALAEPCLFDAVAALLAAPVLVDRGRVTPGSPPLLLGLAGRDEAVPPAPGRDFAAHYGAELHLYPESPHMMRGEDWHDLWGRTGAFLRRHLL